MVDLPRVGQVVVIDGKAQIVESTNGNSYVSRPASYEDLKGRSLPASLPASENPNISQAGTSSYTGPLAEPQPQGKNIIGSVYKDGQKVYTGVVGVEQTSYTYTNQPAQPSQDLQNQPVKMIRNEKGIIIGYENPNTQMSVFAPPISANAQGVSVKTINPYDYSIITTTYNKPEMIEGPRQKMILENIPGVTSFYEKALQPTEINFPTNSGMELEKYIVSEFGKGALITLVNAPEGIYETGKSIYERGPIATGQEMISSTYSSFLINPSRTLGSLATNYLIGDTVFKGAGKVGEFIKTEMKGGKIINTEFFIKNIETEKGLFIEKNFQVIDTAYGITEVTRKSFLGKISYGYDITSLTKTTMTGTLENGALDFGIKVTENIIRDNNIPLENPSQKIKARTESYGFSNTGQVMGSISTITGKIESYTPIPKNELFTALKQNDINIYSKATYNEIKYKLDFEGKSTKSFIKEESFSVEKNMPSKIQQIGATKTWVTARTSNIKVEMFNDIKSDIMNIDGTLNNYGSAGFKIKYKDILDPKRFKDFEYSEFVNRKQPSNINVRTEYTIKPDPDFNKRGYFDIVEKITTKPRNVLNEIYNKEGNTQMANLVESTTNTPPGMIKLQINDAHAIRNVLPRNDNMGLLQTKPIIETINKPTTGTMLQTKLNTQTKTVNSLKSSSMIQFKPMTNTILQTKPMVMLKSSSMLQFKPMTNTILQTKQITQNILQTKQITETLQRFNTRSDYQRPRPLIPSFIEQPPIIIFSKKKSGEKPSQFINKKFGGTKTNNKYSKHDILRVSPLQEMVSVALYGKSTTPRATSSIMRNVTVSVPSKEILKHKNIR